jgi:hypothetical protein
VSPGNPPVIELHFDPERGTSPTSDAHGGRGQDG